jgi:uncharacterized membrane protein YqhA
MLLEKILKIRHIYLIAVFFTLVNSIFFLVAGAMKSTHGYQEYIKLWSGQGQGPPPGLHLAEALDSFLLALVSLIFGLGILKTFVHYQIDDSKLPPWLHIHDFKELKILLWETILVTLVVFNLNFFTEVSWKTLIIPGVILMLSLSLYLMKREGRRHRG